MKKQPKIIFLLLAFSFLLSCEKEEVLIREQAQKNFEVFAYKKSDISQITQKIEDRSKQELFMKSSSTDTEAYWIDEQYIFGAIDDKGNKSFSYRLFFNQIPNNTFYNIIVTERIENEMVPFVIAFEEENGEKKSIRYYELEYFLNALIERQDRITATKTSSLITKDYEETNEPLDFNDCGHLTSGGSGGNDSSTGQGSGGTGTASDQSGYSSSGNYTSTGTYTVYTYGGSGITMTVQTGDANISAWETPDIAKSVSTEDRVICPEGEVIVVENNHLWDEETTLFANPGQEITDINDHLKCFDLTKSAKVTIHVDQPKANSSDTWAGSTDSPDVGHTFISITQGAFTRTVGFYPRGGIKPKISNTANGMFVDDSEHSFDVSVSRTFTPGQLTSLIAGLETSLPNYNLDNLNCTDYCLILVNNKGFNLPDTQGYWPGGGGSNPGNLGQDIRSSSISGSTVDTAGGTAPKNSGNCP